MKKNRTYKIFLAKDRFKFAAAHFTLLGEGRAEHLHGHNYYLSLAMEFLQLDPHFSLSVEMAKPKKVIDRLCGQLDEKVLMPSLSKMVTLKKKGRDLEARVLGRRYVFPASEVVMLPINNLSLEALAAYFCDELEKEFRSYKRLRSFELKIEESRGQKASCCVSVI